VPQFPPFSLGECSPLGTDTVSTVVPHELAVSRPFVASPAAVGAVQECAPGIPGVTTTDRYGTVVCCPLDVCKLNGVDTCGGFECGQREGRAVNCCVTRIVRDNNKCSDTDSAPCIVGESLPQNEIVDCGSVIHPGTTVGLMVGRS